MSRFSVVSSWGMMKIRGNSGLGDAVYLYSVAKHLQDNGELVEVLSNYPEIYEALGCAVQDYDRALTVDLDCNYCHKKGRDSAQMADISEPVGIDLPIRLSRTKPTILVPRWGNPMNNKIDRSELIPDRAPVQDFIDLHDALYIQVGESDQAHSEDWDNIDIDLTDRTSVPALMWLYSAVDGVLSTIGNPVAFAEAFDTPLFCVFAQSGFDSNNRFFSTIRPHKVITKETSYYAVDSDADIAAQMDKWYGGLIWA